MQFFVITKNRLVNDGFNIRRTNRRFYKINFAFFNFLIYMSRIKYNNFTRPKNKRNINIKKTRRRKTTKISKPTKNRKTNIIPNLGKRRGNLKFLGKTRWKIRNVTIIKIKIIIGVNKCKIAKKTINFHLRHFLLFPI